MTYARNFPLCSEIVRTLLTCFRNSEIMQAVYTSEFNGGKVKICQCRMRYCVQYPCCSGLIRHFTVLKQKHFVACLVFSVLRKQKLPYEIAFLSACVPHLSTFLAISRAL
jgi:hypothetical protein